jgi:hypothetical protein
MSILKQLQAIRRDLKADQTLRTPERHEAVGPGSAVWPLAARPIHPANTASLSILQKLRILNTPIRPRLFDIHPLADRPLDFRLQYLAAVAILIAVERAPTTQEQQSYMDLGAALNVDMSDAHEQLSERDSLTVDDIAVLITALHTEQAAWPYLLDVAWIQATKGELDANELAASAEISILLATPPLDASVAARFVLALRHRNRALFEVLPQVFEIDAVRPFLAGFLSPLFPLVNVVEKRWLDHGNGLVTDCTSGIMWPRYFIGQTWENGKALGNAQNYDVRAADFSWTREMEEINSKLQPGGYYDWQIFISDTKLIDLRHSYGSRQFGPLKVNMKTGSFAESPKGFALVPHIATDKPVWLPMQRNSELLLINIGYWFFTPYSGYTVYLLPCRDSLPADPSTLAS